MSSFTSLRAAGAALGLFMGSQFKYDLITDINNPE
jgi:hypothetical protein